MEQRPAGKRAKKLTGRDDTLFFVHIPRSGGTALRHMMERVVERSDEWRVYDWQTQQEAIHAERATIARYRLVVGHFRIGVWAPFADQPLVTVLREPMGRMQSSYRYNRMFPNQLLHQAANQMDFDAFVRASATIRPTSCRPAFPRMTWAGPRSIASSPASMWLKPWATWPSPACWVV
jgi:hypothetical protein